MQPIVVQLNRGKIILMLLGSLAFVAAAVWLWLSAGKSSFLKPYLQQLIALVGVAFFGLCAFYACVKVADARPGLIIDDDGIIDNSSGAAVGRIHWDDVTGLNVNSVAGNRFLTVLVIDPEKYRARARGLARFFVRMDMTGSPINISASALHIDFDELKRLITFRLERYRARKAEGIREA